MSEIRVKRATGFAGMISRFPVFINDQKVGLIGNNDEAVFPIAGNQAVVRVGAAFAKTKPVIVEAGQTLVVETNTINFSAYLFLVILGLLFNGLLRALLIATALVLMFVLPTYTAKIEE